MPYFTDAVATDYVQSGQYKVNSMFIMPHNYDAYIATVMVDFDAYTHFYI